jgi:hypothetical protein
LIFPKINAKLELTLLKQTTISIIIKYNYMKPGAIKYSILFLFLLIPLLNAKADGLSDRLKGKILLQVEDAGQAWYVEPETKQRAFLGRPSDAFRIMRELGLGISEQTYNSFNGYAPDNLAGKILLRVKANGEAYYVNPDDNKLHFLNRPTDAFGVMRNLGLGIKNEKLNQISIHNKYKQNNITGNSNQNNSNNQTNNNSEIESLKKQLAQQEELLQELMNTQEKNSDDNSKENTNDALTANQIFEKIAPSVVYIQSPDSRGTGFIIESDSSGSQIITNAHVVGTNKSVIVHFRDGFSTEANIIGKRVEVDLALLATSDGLERQVVTFGNTNNLRQGDDVYTIGYPEGIPDDISIKEGIFSRRIELDKMLFEHTAEMHPGNSGGPLVNSKGNVIGVNTQIENKNIIADPVKLSIPIGTVESYMTILKSGN